MPDNEDVIDRLENESKTQQDEEESSDEEYTLDVKKEQKSDDEDEDEENSGKEKKNWRKATPEEVFARFDEDNSGFIDFEEFRNMLPHLNVNLSEAKALKYFRQCDTDNSGEILRFIFIKERLFLFCIIPTKKCILDFTWMAEFTRRSPINCN